MSSSPLHKQVTVHSWRPRNPLNERTTGLGRGGSYGDVQEWSIQVRQPVGQHHFGRGSGWRPRLTCSEPEASDETVLNPLNAWPRRPVGSNPTPSARSRADPRASHQPRAGRGPSWADAHAAATYLMSSVATISANASRSWSEVSG